ncbi:TMEM175 family protein [Catellatospora methionotrophica]|uniref:TMEM175 family protein n=1 Tax=Catellatospora methionotrophica TaxID=121620 RepID=UPI00140DF82C|nr:TMEM175 family protein [Catellatospora methionotrophica]
MVTRGVQESRSLVRLTAYTDGVVAIALTLLVLPLVDTARDAQTESVRDLVREHAGDFAAFVMSFLVVSLFWMVHRRVFDNLVDVGEGIMLLNRMWLLGVVFLPVPTAVLTYEVNQGRGATLLYMANLVFIALSGLLLSLRIRDRVPLQRPGHAEAVDRSVRRGVIATSAMVGTLVAAIFLANFALPLLALMPLLQAVAERRARRHGHPAEHHH